MWSKGHRRLTDAEREHLALVKGLPCSVCYSQEGSEAHHIQQECHFSVVALCATCHRHPVYGWHGQRRAWHARKMDEIKALNETLRLLCKDPD